MTLEPLAAHRHGRLTWTARMACWVIGMIGADALEHQRAARHDLSAQQAMRAVYVSLATLS